jgi:hypothetical protein
MAKSRKIKLTSLFDGEVHLLKLGVHFKDAARFRKRLYKWWARRRTHAMKRLKTRFDGKLMTVQIVRRLTKSTCRVCGRKFLPTVARRAYCSQKCASKPPFPPGKPGSNTIKAVKLWNEKGLAQTGISRELGVSRQRVAQILHKHSHELNVPLKDRRQPMPRKSRPCPVCGNEIVLCVSSRKYCSKACRHAALIAKAAPWSRLARVNLVCETCGKKFTRPKHQQSISEVCGSEHIYCSQKCYWKRPARLRFRK